MIYTLFFSRRRRLPPEEEREYLSRSEELRALAEERHAGFLGMKTYLAEDGERLTIVRFRDADSQAEWKRDHHHREAQGLGRSSYYESYRVVICGPIRERGWTRAEGSELDQQGQGGG